MNSEQPSQTELANALGLARSRITAMKKEGMPVHSLEAAHAWRQARQNIARRKPLPRKLTAAPQAGALAANASALMQIAATALASGEAIDSLVPTLRAALSAVPRHERGHVDLQSSDVMRLLLAHVLDMIPPREENPLNDDGSPVWCDGAAMTRDDAQFCGEVWYEIAAGELLYDA